MVLENDIDRVQVENILSLLIYKDYLRLITLSYKYPELHSTIVNLLRKEGLNVDTEEE